MPRREPKGAALVLFLLGALAVAGCRPFTTGDFGVGAGFEPYVLTGGTENRLKPGMGFEVHVYRGSGLDPRSGAFFPINALAQIDVSWHEIKNTGGLDAVYLRGRFGGVLIGPARWGRHRGFWRGSWTIGGGVGMYGIISESPGEDAPGVGIWLRPGLALWAGRRTVFELQALLDGWFEARNASLVGSVAANLALTARF